MEEVNSYVPLPLYSDADYFYNISLERVAYRIRLYYNERMEMWMIDLRYANNDPIIIGEALVPEYPLFLDYIIGLSGFFWLSPIGKLQNETTTNPFELYKYFELNYFYRDDNA